MHHKNNNDNEKLQQQRFGQYFHVRKWLNISGTNVTLINSFYR